MEFYIEKDKYSYSDEQLSNQMLNYGDEADVYRIKGQAVKIYKQFCPKTRLDERTVEYLKTIDTKRLLLPRKTVYDEFNKFNGYTTKLITEGSKSLIGKLKMSKMISEMKLLTEDVEVLSELGITIDDLDYRDVLYGDENGIYYCDPGSFTIEKYMTPKEIKIFNKEKLHDLLIDEILTPTCNLTKKQKYNLKSMTLSGDYLSDLFSYEDYKEYESATHFVKRITK